MNLIKGQIDRILLLQEVARVNGSCEWGEITGHSYLTFKDGLWDEGMEPTLWLDQQGDHADAAAIVAMLDGIEEYGYYSSVGSAPFSELPDYVETELPFGFKCSFVDSNDDMRVSRATYGRTRAEAVARAYVSRDG